MAIQYHYVLSGRFYRYVYRIITPIIYSRYMAGKCVTTSKLLLRSEVNKQREDLHKICSIFQLKNVK